jgi:FkbM family methyltransferase
MTNIWVDFTSAKGRFARTLRTLARRVPKDMVVPVLQGPLAGTRWIAGSFTAGCWLGSYESLNQQMLAGMLEPGDVFFDIGANVGFFTLLASKLVGPAGHVYAYEPIPSNVAVLRRHLHLNHATNVTVLPFAVWDSACTLRFTGSRSMARQSARGEQEIDAIAIDDLFRRGELPAPTVIKMDVEGAELPALNGMRELIRNARPQLLIEFHRSTLDGVDCDAAALDLLHELGYASTRLTNGEVHAAFAKTTA